MTEKEKVPNAIVARASKASHMGKERELLAKRQMLEQQAQKKYDELDEIFQKLADTKADIEHHRRKQEL